MKKLFTSLQGFAVIALAAAPRFFAAAVGPIEPPATIGRLGSTGGGAIGLMCLAARWIFTGAIILSIILALMTAIQYMTASGEPEKLKTAHKRLLYLTIGIAVAIVARTLPVFVAGLLNSGNGAALGGVCS